MARDIGEGTAWRMVRAVEKIRVQHHPVALVTPAHADPYMNPVRWARLLPEIDENSTIGYAFL